MAKQNLPQLIEWLSRNELNRFEIYDVDAEEAIDKCISYEALTAEFERPMSYFEDLAENGIKTIQIFKKIKNGSSFRKKGCGLNFAIATKSTQNVAASGTPVSPGATPQQNTGLMGSGTGLSMPEIMTMRSAADRLPEAKTLIEKLERKTETQEADIKRLERENLKLQFGKESQPSSLDKLLDGIASNPAVIGQFMSSLKPGGQAGLNSPQLEEKALSDTKSMVVDLISNNQQVSDEHVNAAYYIILEALKGNQTFLDAYIKLLKEHNLIEDASNNNNNG